MLKAFKNSFRANSMQTIITFYFTLLIAIGMIMMSAILYNKFNQTAKTTASMSTSQIMDQVNINLEYYLKGMNEVSSLVNSELKNGSVNGKSKIKSLLKMALSLRKDIVTLAVFSEKGDLIISSSDAKLNSGFKAGEEGWFNRAKLQPEKLYFSEPHVENLFAGKHPWVVSLSRQTDIFDNGIVSNGILLVNMNFSAIDELCSNVGLGKRGYMYIINKDGNIIYHPQQQLIYAGLKKENLSFAVNQKQGNYIQDYNGEQAVVSIKNVNYTGWKLVGISYFNDVITAKSDIYYYFVFILLISIFIMSFISIVMSAKISKPLKKLERLMKKVEQGDFDIYAEVEGEYEVKHLSKTFNLMISQIRNLMDQIVKEQEQKTKSEIKALQAQINPHFLYNTLDSIVWMAENNENHGVIKMVTALANLFRISISRGGDIIDIQGEIEHARSYLTIQQIRYGDKFDFYIEELPAFMYRYKTLKIILQPIIENAIYHGIKQMVDKGQIDIRCELIDDKVCFSVTDNGVGMSQEKVSKILLNENSGKRLSGIGVKNVHDRIQLYYGKEYGLDIKSEIDEGTIVKIWLPLIKGDEGGKI